MLTIVIPTKNRPSFLLRTLDYYRQQHFGYPIVVADSSAPDRLNQVQPAIDLIKRDLVLEYRTYPADLQFADKLADALATVETPCVALGADDDFFVPPTLTEAAEFLQAYPDYAVAHGESLVLSLSSGTAYGSIERLSVYNQRAIEHPDSLERFFDHLAHYSTTWYSVQRTEKLVENFDKTRALGADIRFGELLPSCLSLIQGKAKKLNRLYMVRQGGRKPKEYAASDLYDWIASPDWPNQYAAFRDRLAETLVQDCKIEFTEARNKIKVAFWMFWAPHLVEGLPVLAHSKVSKRIEPSTRLCSLSAIRVVWQKLRRLMNGNEISLSTVLNPSSPYHADFIPIYYAVTVPPAEFMNLVNA